MRTVGLFEAKTRLSELCQQVADSHEPVLITKRGKAMVRIIAVGDGPGGSSIWASADAFRRQHALDADLELPLRTEADERPEVEFE